MNRLFVGIAIGLLTMLAPIYLAQTHAEQGGHETQQPMSMMHGMAPQGMMQKCMGMMQGMHRGMKPGLKAEAYLKRAKELELSEEQIASLKGIVSQAQKEITVKQAERKVAEIELKELLEKDSELRLIETKLKEIANADMALRLIRIKADMDAKKLLTPQQVEKLKKTPTPMSHGHGSS